MSKYLFLTGLVIMISFAAEAQRRGRPQFEIRASGGVSNPVRTHQAGNENGFLGTLGARYYSDPDSHFAIGLDYQFNYFDFENNPDASYTIHGYMVSAEYYLIEGNFHPYFGLSTGLFNSRQDQALPGTGDNVNSFTRFGFIPRFGLNYELSDKVSGFLDIGFRYISRENRGDSFYDGGLGLSFKL